MARVALNGVRKVYAGGVEAVKGVTLDIPDGAFGVLVGPSGCGKSTLLRMVAGLEQITEGEVTIGERVVNKLEPADRDIAMVFQNYALYPHMTVYQNLAYGLKNRGTPKPEIDARVREAARILAIEDFLDRKPRQLSGGQRQRVAMGRAIVRKPACFLFDEPLSNLDAKLRVQMRIEIRRLQRALGTTSIYVTHDQLEAMTLADMLVVMNAGRVEQIGTPMELYERPQTAFVAAFIGSPAMNLLNAEGSEAGLRLAGGGAGLSGGPRRFSGPVLVGVRPEHLVINGANPPEDGLMLALTVTGVEPVGAESYVHATLDGGTEVVLRASGKASFELGAQITAHAPAGMLHFFDAANGRRLDA